MLTVYLSVHASNCECVCNVVVCLLSNPDLSVTLSAAAAAAVFIELIACLSACVYFAVSALLKRR